MFYENRLGIKKSVIRFVYLFCPNTGTKFREPYHLNHVIPHRELRNNYGNKLLQLCCNNDLYICNGRLNGDLTGAYTCTKGSVKDYLIANIDG